ncbi:MAG: hypothetical protein JSR45_15975 [Proteobacteria bacterium]|nr:hypothetical protein [Pseudomonadota bacterium]
MAQLWGRLASAWAEADAVLEGRLWMLAVLAALLLVAMILPRRRAGGLRAPWPGLWACGAVGALGAVALILR